LIKAVKQLSLSNKIVSMILAVIMFISTAMTGTLAWTSLDQSALNEFSGTTSGTGGDSEYTIVLVKLEKALDGTTTETPIQGAEFEFYKQTSSGDEKVGTYTTDEKGNITLNNIIEGNYYFLETNPTADFTYDTEADGTLKKKYSFSTSEADSQRKINITAYNKRLPSQLIVTKTVVNADGSELTDAQKQIEFEFTVTFGDGKAYKYSIDDAEETFDTVDGKFTLKHGQKAIFRNVPAGITYRVVEKKLPNYTVTSKNSSNNIVYTEENNVNLAEFTNTYSVGGGGEKYGDLEITKTVTGDNAQTDRLFTFRVTIGTDENEEYTCTIGENSTTIKSGDEIKLSHGQTAVIRHIPYGTRYIVEETDANTDGYTATVDTVRGNITTVTSHASFINDRPSDTTPGEGSLSIKKTVSGTGADEAKKFDFTLTFDDTDVAIENKVSEYKYTLNGGEETVFVNGTKISLAHNDVIKFTELPSGTKYTLTEDDYTEEGYISNEKEHTGIIAKGDVNTITVNNDKSQEKQKTKLIVRKITTGEGADLTKKFEFTLTVNGTVLDTFELANGETKEFTLEIGDVYEVTEKNYAADRYYQVGAENCAGTMSVSEITATKTNKYTPGGSGDDDIDVTVKKEWKTNSTIPASVKVQLYENGTAYGEAVLLSNDNSWTYTWRNLSKDSTWTVDELDVPSRFSKKITGSVTEGFTITNTYYSGGGGGTTSVSVEKVWDDSNDKDNLRPDSIKVQLYENGSEYGLPVTLSASNGWSTRWTHLSKGSTWTVDEVDVPTGYTKRISGSASDGFRITNTHTPGSSEDKDYTSVTVKKAWSVPEGVKIPESVEITLYRNNAKYSTAVLNNSNAWTYTWTRLDKNSSWTVDELTVPDGFRKTISGSADSGFVVTNIYRTTTGGDKTVSVKKVWAGDANPDQPISIEVYLYRDGVRNSGVILNASNNWTHTWTGLDENSAWTVDESNVPAGYIKTIAGSVETGFVITNTYSTNKPDTTSVTVNKLWDVPSGVALPESVGVVLYKNGTQYELVALSARNNWSYAWTGLDSTAVWTVDEPSVPASFEKTVAGSAQSGFVITNKYTGTPDKPTTPDKPNKPVTPGKPVPNVPQGTAPQTGDNTNILLWFATMIMSAFALKYILFSAKNRE